jgi:parallel beta-helix repeat protein
MRSKSVIICGLFLSFFFLRSIEFSTFETRASDGYPVHNLDTELNYSTIQEAINAASPGDTIIVEAGTYFENVVVNKDGMKILGHGANDTTVDGGGQETVFHIEANNVTICGFAVRNCSTGIFLYRASNCSVFNNDVKLTKFGIRLSFSSSCCIYENNSTDNEYNIRMDYSSNNNLTRNTMRGSRYNFGVSGSSLEHFIQKVDNSNTANGKPVYYIVNTENLTVNPQNYLNLGYLAIVNSSEITVEDLTISNNFHGILFAYTSKSTLRNVTAVNNKVGFDLYHCSNCAVFDNAAVYNMYHGILLGGSSQCVVYGNNLTSNTEGIRITYSSDCSVSSNTVCNNECGIRMDYASNNEVFHNNIISNTEQVYVSDSLTSMFDDGFEGNYWSDHYFQDLDQNGICDSQYIVAAGIVDKYPLMGIYYNFRITDQLDLGVISNVTIGNFVADQENKTIAFGLTEVDGANGFCRICVPKAFIDKPNVILIHNGTEVLINSTIFENESHSWFYFSCSSPSEVTVVSELNLKVVLLFLIPFAFIVMVSRRNKSSLAKS